MTYLLKVFRAIVFFRRPVVSFFLLLCATIGLAKDGARYNLNNDYVLIINSYMESNSWSNSIITPAVDHITTLGLNVFAEHLSVMNLHSYELLGEFESDLFEKYKNRPPRLIILLDNPSLLLKDAIQRVWKDVPIILCAEQDFILPSQCYFNRIFSINEGPVALSSYLQDSNITFLHCPVYLKENIDLMRYVIPNMKELIFVADDWVINKQINAQLSQLLQTEYAEIKYRFLSSENVTADEVMQELSYIDILTTGVLFSSWFQRTHIAGNTLLLANSHKVFAANSIAPIFSLRYTNIRYGGMVGGHIFDQDEYIKHLLNIISSVLRGVSPRSIPYYCPKQSRPTFNYAILLQKGLSLNVCPPGSAYIVMPPTFFQKYKYGLFAILFILLTITFVTIQQNRIRALRKVKVAQQRLKDTNDKLSIILSVAKLLTWKWDLMSDTIHYDLNKDVAKSTIYEDENTLSVTPGEYLDQIVPTDQERVMLNYTHLKQGDVGYVSMQYQVRRFNGKPGNYWVEVHAAVVDWSKDNKPLVVIGSLLDISERKRMEQALVMSKERAEESNRLKSAFLANISHEIRTPLNAIVGFSTILLTTENKDERREYMDIIEKNNELLLQLIGDIIYLSEIDAGRLEFNYTVVELNHLMETLSIRIRSQIIRSWIDFTFVPELPECFFLTDKDRLVQILTNLLSNAVKFTTNGSIRFGYEKQTGFIYFYVTDTGCGIPESKQEAVFKRFVKLNDFSQGAGLGLSICQIIVQQMGGEIGVVSEEGKGSTFWFTLPCGDETQIDANT